MYNNKINKNEAMDKFQIQYGVYQITYSTAYLN